MTPIAKDGACRICGRKFTATGQTFPEIEAAVNRAVDDHMLRDHPEDL